MITYIIRRLLYSVLVLIAASFLVFMFVARAPATRWARSALRPNMTRRASIASPRRST